MTRMLVIPPCVVKITWVHLDTVMRRGNPDVLTGLLHMFSFLVLYSMRDSARRTVMYPPYWPLVHKYYNSCLEWRHWKWVSVAA